MLVLPYPVTQGVRGPRITDYSELEGTHRDQTPVPAQEGVQERPEGEMLQDHSRLCLANACHGFNTLCLPNTTLGRRGGR